MKIPSTSIYLSLIVLSLLFTPKVWAQQQVCLDCIGSISPGLAYPAPTVVGSSGALTITLVQGENTAIKFMLVGSTYRFSTCQQTTADTYMYLSDGRLNTVICNDNHCGLQSRFDFSPTDVLELAHVLNVRESGTCNMLKSTVDVIVTLISTGNPGGGPGGGGGGPPFTTPPSVNLWQASGTTALTTSRNVGIGVTSPSTALEVDGDILASGSMDASSYLLSGSPMLPGKWSELGSAISYGGGNVGIGVTSP